MAGLVAEYTLPVQVRVNGQNLARTDDTVMYGSYVQLDALDSDFADKAFPGDGDGNLYKAVTATHAANLSYLGTNPQSYINVGYSKSTNESQNDWSDLINLTYVLNNAPAATYFESVSAVVNVEQWVRWFAMQTMLSNQETNLGNGVGDDYSFYRGVQDQRFVLLTHDMDTILGSGGTTGVGDSIWRACGVPTVNRFLRDPVIARMYQAALIELINTVFSPAQFNPLIDQLLGLYVLPATINSMKSFVVSRSASVLGQIPRQFTINRNLPELPIVDGYSHTTSTGVHLEGTAPAVTGSVLVNGSLADFSTIDGKWSIDPGRWASWSAPATACRITCPPAATPRPIGPRRPSTTRHGPAAPRAPRS